MSSDPDQIGARVAEEIGKFFGVPAAAIERSTTALDVDGWDSVRHTILLMHLEQIFNFEFPEEKIVSMANVGELIDTIRDGVAGKGH